MKNLYIFSVVIAAFISAIVGGFLAFLTSREDNKKDEEE